MSSLQLKRIVLVLVVVLGLWGLAALFGGREIDELDVLTVPRLSAGTVDEIRVIRPADSVKLAKGAVNWTVNGHPAAQSELDDLFEALEDTTLSSELVARSTGLHGRMGVDSAQGRFITFFRNEVPLADLVLGDRGRQFETGYLRRQGEDDVYLIRGRLHDLLDRDETAWRDKEIAVADTSTVESVELTRGGMSYTLSRGDSAWQLDGGAADSLTVQRILMELAAVRATGFATEAQLDSIDFSRAERRLTARGPQGAELFRLAFDSAASWFWAQRDGAGTVYRVDRWRVDRLVPPDSTLRGTD